MKTDKVFINKKNKKPLKGESIPFKGFSCSCEVYPKKDIRTPAATAEPITPEMLEAIQ